MFEYKTISVSPEGIRVKGDDMSERLSELLNKHFNQYAKSGWRVISLLPTMKSEGAVTKILITLERKKVN